MTHRFTTTRLGLNFLTNEIRSQNWNGSAEPLYQNPFWTLLTWWFGRSNKKKQPTLICLCFFYCMTFNISLDKNSGKPSFCATNFGSIQPLQMWKHQIQVESATIFGEANFGACCIDDLGVSRWQVDGEDLWKDTPLETRFFPGFLLNNMS